MRKTLTVLLLGLLAALLLTPASASAEEPPVVDEQVPLVDGTPPETDTEAPPAEPEQADQSEWYAVLARGGCDVRSRTGSVDFVAPGYRVERKIKMTFSHCGNFDQFEKAVYSTKTINAGDGCSFADEHRFNIGAYGTWNPPMRTLSCATGPVGEVHKQTVYPPASGENIGHSNNDRCAYFYLTTPINGSSQVDRVTSASPACLN